MQKAGQECARFSAVMSGETNQYLISDRQHFNKIVPEPIISSVVNYI